MSKADSTAGSTIGSALNTAGAAAGSPVSSFSGADVARRTDELKISDMAAEEKRKAVVSDTQKKADELQQFIYSNANPNPILVTICVIFVLVGVWLLYVIFVKPSLSGKWRDTDGCIWLIRHNKFSNSLDIRRTVRGTGEDSNKYSIDTGHGTIIDNMFRYQLVTGIWDYRDIILFISGNGMQRIHE